MQNVLLARPSSSSSFDAVFELAGVLLASALWLQGRGVFVCQDSQGGVDTNEALQARAALPPVLLCIPCSVVEGVEALHNTQATVRHF